MSGAYVNTMQDKKSSAFKRVVIFLVFLECMLIAGLAWWVLDKRTPQVIVDTSSAINEEDITYPETENLEYYFEPKPGTPEITKPSWLAEVPVVTINNDTLNERYDYTQHKATTTYRIVTLGDSWTYGQFVSTKDNYSEQLEDMLNERYQCEHIDAFEVINLGVGSYDVAYAVERFIRRGAKYGPDLLVWFFTGNDFDEINELMRPYSTEYLNDLEQKNVEIEYNDVTGVKGMHVDSGNANFALAWLAAREYLTETMTEEEIAEFQLSHMLRLEQHYNGPLLIYTLQNASNVGDHGEGVIREYVADVSNASWYQSELVLDREKHVLADGHPNVVGHEHIAEDLLSQIIRNPQLVCSEI